MHYTQAFSLLPLVLLTPLTVAAPAAEPQTANPPPQCPPEKKPQGCFFPDQYQPGPNSFRGFTGNFIGAGFPYFYDLPVDPAGLVPSRICPGRVDDTVRRALQINRVANNYFQYTDPNGPIKGDPVNLQRCQNVLTPIFQGTTYIGGYQIFITFDQDGTNNNPEGQTVTYCGYSSEKADFTKRHDAIEQFIQDCTIPVTS
ncbi:uncharacterized protein J3D65DRAFT_599737 [Phyllosticta citribraziliensis]|uniref:Uncharacterized protein n=1 Tax=Phyllosticta citribraziliensis TaxID=989973 RepID=A0ABR1MBB9_9PEZI